MFNRRVGTEFSAQGAEIARATGAEVFVGGIEQVSPDRKFDCIVAIQVIEHVYQPLSFVKQVASHTKAGGYIVVATPDIGGALRKTMGRRWPSLKVPEHVVYFDFQSLRALMHQAGLIDVRRLPYPHAFPLGLITAKFGLIRHLHLRALKCGCLLRRLLLMEESVAPNRGSYSSRWLYPFFARARICRRC